MPHDRFWCLWAIWLISLEPASAVFVVNRTLGDSVFFHQFVYWNAPLEWRFGDDEVVAARPFYAAPYCYPRYQGRCQLSSEGALQLNNLTYSDQGQYVFIVGAIKPYHSQIVYYQLQIYPTLTAPALVPNSVPDRLVNGSYVSLHCDASKQNVATYTFYRNGKNICSERHVICRDSNLYFKTISKHDSGRYTCTIQNPASTSTSNILQLSVSAPTFAAELTSNKTELVWEGETVSFNCSTQLIDANFTWHVDGSFLPGGDQYQLFIDSSGQISTLIISPVFRNNTGSYTCQAYNATMNETSNALNLSVSNSPDNSSIYCGSEAYTGGVVLICSWAGGQPAADIQLSFNGTVDLGKDAVNRSVLLGNEVQQSVLTCEGNQLGNTSTCNKTFERPLSLNHNNSAVTSATEGQNATLTVSLTSPDSLISEFTWFHLNPNPATITSNGKYKVESTGSQSILFISSLIGNDSGAYECRAKNVIGSTAFNFTLEVKSQGSSGSSGLSGGAIAGIVIGVLAGVALIGVGGFFLVKKLK